METAILGFRDILPNATWEIDPDVQGLTHAGEPSPVLGTAMLQKLGEEKLLELYSQQVGIVHSEKKNEWQRAADRWHLFIDRLRERSEKRFILVVPQWVVIMSGLEIPP